MKTQLNDSVSDQLKPDNVRTATILDFETTGQAWYKDKPTDVGLYSFTYLDTGEILQVVDSYESLNDPGIPIPPDISEITHLTDDDVRGHSIDWDRMAQILEKSDIVICHNSSFDRKFLESNAPEHLRPLLLKLRFACTLREISWKEKGFENTSLGEISAAIGYEFVAHRALNDCKAVFNVLKNVDGAFLELLNNVKRSQIQVAYIDKDQRDLFKEHGFKRFYKTEKMPSHWGIDVYDDAQMQNVNTFLRNRIFGGSVQQQDIYCRTLTAADRFSFRAYWDHYNSMTSFQDRKNQEGYTEHDYVYLMRDKYGRFLKDNNKNPRKAHALVTEDASGNKFFKQFHLPTPTKNINDIPTIVELTDIEEVERAGSNYYRGRDKRGIKYISQRHIKMRTDGVESELACFSEGEEAPPERTNKIPRFRADLTEEQHEEIKTVLNNTVTVKGGEEVIIDPASIRARENFPLRSMDQNTVMGSSACEATAQVYNDFKHLISQELLKVLEQASQAKLDNSEERSDRDEWLHALAHSLAHIGMDPQQANNLGAAGAFANTEMMIFEDLAKWFSTQPGSIVSVIPRFEMFIKDLIDTIHYEVKIKHNDKTLSLIMDSDVLVKSPIRRKTSDLAQTTGVAYALLHNHAPVSEQPVQPFKTQSSETPSNKRKLQTDPKALKQMNTARKRKDRFFSSSEEKNEGTSDINQNPGP